MRAFTVILMMLVGAVFVASPAGLLAKLTPESLDVTFWIIVIFVYYILATLLPIDKIIGKVYPLFAIALIFMALGLLTMLYVNAPELPELWDTSKIRILMRKQPHLPDDVHHNCLWSHFRFSCNSKPVDGTLHAQ